MTLWQRRARLGVAVAGIAVAAAVYGGLRERAPREAPARVERLDPTAVAETTAGHGYHVRGGELEFEITWARMLSYQDGSTRQFGVSITVHRGEGHAYVITAREAEAGRDRIEVQLTGDVVLITNDGLRLETERGSFNQQDGVVRAPGRVTFEKGRLTGSGVGMSYDEQRDLLEVADRSQVRMAGEGGQTVMQFAATAATLDRAQDWLSLSGHVRARRGTQIIEADRGDAHLSPAHDAITRIELRGRSRVAGGEASPGTMEAHDIDLHYSDSGETLERVAMRGAASVAIGGAGGAAPRRLAGEVLDLELAPDGALTAARGHGDVRLDLAAGPDTPAGVVRSRTLTATGAPGRGLTEADFEGSVEYLEGAPEVAPRSARAERLRTTLADEGLGSAIFTTGVVFAADGYDASAGEARYRPDAGVLELRTGDAREAPRVRDDRMTIDAESIDLALDEQRIQARGQVRTVFGAGGAEGGRLPGLLQLDAPAHVTAATLEYDGAALMARYAGAAVLWQGGTTLRADAIRIDQMRGDLLATGSARSTMPLDTGRLDGRAHEIAYDDGQRVLRYTAAADRMGGRASGAAREAAPAELAHLVGPAGDLRARRIDVRLRPDDGSMERIEAETGVRVDTGGRTATGATLTYHAEDERYEMTGTIEVPVRVVDACGETSGRTLIFFTSADRMMVDGHEQMRTRTTSHGSCDGPPLP